MRPKWLYGVAGGMGALTAGLVVLAGCGGGGGPITPPETGPGPSISAQFVELMPVEQRNVSYVGSDKCATSTCHNDGYHQNWKDTRHAQVNVGCEQCHGPGALHVQNRQANIVQADILTYPKVTEPIVCGQCHGPTFDQFHNSRHASAVEEVIESAHANPASGKTCLRCHGAPLRTQFINSTWTKGLLEGKDIATIQNEADAAILATPNDKIAELALLSHQSANCVTCHDPHTKTGKVTSTGNEAHLRRSTFSVDATPILPGSPAKVHSNFDHVCGTCHNGRGGDPSDARLQTGTARPSFHEGPQFNMLLGVTGSLPPGTVVQNSSHRDTPDQCVHCHMPNRRHTFTVSVDTSCQPCHTPTDAAARAGQIRNEILTGLLVLRTRMENWAKTKFATVPAGWTGSPSELWNYSTIATEDTAQQAISASIQSQIPIEIKRARHNYFFIIRDRSFGVHNAPYTRQLLAFSQSQLDALGVPRSATTKASTKQTQQIINEDLLRSIRSEKGSAWDHPSM
jgi:hypothetical protein